MVYPRIAVIGSGPAGLYTCARLIQKFPKGQIDVFDRNPVPYGLVYYGVAPDHVDMKKCTNQFKKMFNEQSSRLSLYCNVNVGTDLKYEELCSKYEAIVLAYGASKARTLNIKNERAVNCFSGSDFVSWYNGQPRTSATPILDKDIAIVIGNGNVAIDCSRILLSNVEKLACTDIPEYAMQNIRNSKVRNVRILGRRGPKEVSFTIKELRELLNLEDCYSACRISPNVLSNLNEAIKTADRPKKRLFELMRSHINTKAVLNTTKECLIEFYQTPQRIITDERGRVREIEVKNTEKDEVLSIPCGLLIYAIGFENILLPGLPKTVDNRLEMLDWCRVPDENASVYATGWCAHLARGVIADSQRQAIEVADELAEDWRQGKVRRKPDSQQWNMGELLKLRHIQYISWTDCLYIDECEQRMGALLGKPREKLNDMITLLKIRNTF